MAEVAAALVTQEARDLGPCAVCQQTVFASQQRCKTLDGLLYQHLSCANQCPSVSVTPVEMPGVAFMETPTPIQPIQPQHSGSSQSPPVSVMPVEMPEVAFMETPTPIQPIQQPQRSGGSFQMREARFIKRANSIEITDDEMKKFVRLRREEVRMRR